MVFEAGDRRLRGERLAGHGVPPEQQLVNGVVAQPVGIVPIGMATRDAEDPLAEQVRQRMPDLARLPVVDQTLGESLDQAVAAFRQAIDLGSDRFLPYYLAARLMIESGRAGPGDHVRHWLRQAIDIRPQFAGAYTLLAGLLVDADPMSSEARQLARRAVELEPTVVHHWVALAEVLLAQNDIEDARAVVAEATPWIRSPQDQARLRAVGTRTRSAEAVLARAQVLRAAGSLNAAAAAYRDTVRLDPRNAAAFNGLGWTLFDLGRLDESAAAHRAAIEIIRGHSGRWSCGAATGKPRKPGRPTGASGHWPTARRRGRIVSPGCTHGARRGRWSSPGRRCGCGAFSRRRVGWNSGEPTAGESVDVSGAAQSRSQTRPLPALSGRPPAQHRLRSATASASTRTVPGLARRRPPLGQGPAGQVWRGWSDWQAVSPVARLTPPVLVPHGPTRYWLESQCTSEGLSPPSFGPCSSALEVGADASDRKGESTLSTVTVARGSPKTSKKASWNSFVFRSSLNTGHSR